ncbi:Lrp/AsnC family transcriptional regulator [Amycolatopsis rubida]|uniref:Lrp/AsnC family transcriptional regulator n=2 Tax=Pseudonocardiaceae TaxID=2070 RepID=A0ABX0BZ87_9PSEU|nr:AsnC family transcriptional regulator [Amycolatopsis rubida]NEC60233.1 Lrp/AsnC family transcriptional regulator [Amycolatopsis rubida]OAP28357.1 Regulatory protein AsnC [Amycolatopsis sp. M39]
MTDSVISYREVMKPVTLDVVDRQLIHALDLDGRAPFARIADVLGVSENTVGRRYRRLRQAGVLRVVGAVASARLGYALWTVRFACAPAFGIPIATALAKRPDTFWVHLLSGGTEIACTTQSSIVEQTDVLLLDKLPRSSRITSVSAHQMLHGFTRLGRWSALSDEQIAALRVPVDPTEEITFDDADRRLGQVLADDGRAGYGELAAVSGLSESTVKRRIETLRRTGLLSYQLDISPRALGFQSEARLWMIVRPSAVASVASALAEHEEVQFAAVTTGPANLVAAIACRNATHLYEYLTGDVGSLDGIQQMETAPVVRTVKRSGSLLPL